MSQKKKKRDLFVTIQAIERYHQRRSSFVIHTTLSLAVQVAIWANWYSSYAVHGIGFQNNFFTDRAIVSLVLCVFLIGHYALTRVMETKDRMVIQALQRYDDDSEAIVQSDVESIPDEANRLELDAVAVAKRRNT